MLVVLLCLTPSVPPSWPWSVRCSAVQVAAPAAVPLPQSSTGVQLLQRAGRRPLGTSSIGGALRLGGPIDRFRASCLTRLCRARAFLVGVPVPGRRPSCPPLGYACHHSARAVGISVSSSGRATSELVDRSTLYRCRFRLFPLLAVDRWWDRIGDDASKSQHRLSVFPVASSILFSEYELHGIRGAG